MLLKNKKKRDELSLLVTVRGVSVLAYLLVAYSSIWALMIQ